MVENKIEQAPEIQGDEEVLNTLRSWFIANFSPHLEFPGVKIPCRKLMPEPKNRYLKSIWKYGHIDLPEFRYGKFDNGVEPGGNRHFQDDKQRLRDLKKDALCKLNGIKILRITNDVVNHLNSKQTKRLFRKFFYNQDGSK